MNSSRPQSRNDLHTASLDFAQPLFAPISASELLGGFNDEVAVREMVTKAIKVCGKSRDQIADEMTLLLGSKVTRRALDSYTSEAADLNRFPAQYIRAFCFITGDKSLIHYAAERSGLHVISGDDLKLLNLGRQLLLHERTAAAIATLKAELQEVAL